MPFLLVNGRDDLVILQRLKILVAGVSVEIEEGNKHRRKQRLVFAQPNVREHAYKTISADLPTPHPNEPSGNNGESGDNGEIGECKTLTTLSPEASISVRNGGFAFREGSL